MDISDILLAFNTTKGRFPSDAVNSAITKQAEITPILIETLKNTITNYKTIDLERLDYLFAFFLLSKFREPSAFSYILQIAALPEEYLENILGDCITEALPRFIVSTFDGNLSAIKELIENENAYDWSRDAALRSLIGLIAIQKLNRTEVIDYLKELFASSLTTNTEFTTSLVNAACDLYPEELQTEIKKAFAEKKVDDWNVDMKWVEKTLSIGKEACLKEHVYDDNFQLPIEDIEKSMSWMAAFHPQSREKFDHDEYHYIEARTTPKIGRNESCPCGSGKKYKKCCLH